MKQDDLSPGEKPSGGSRWMWILAAGCVLVLILPLLLMMRDGGGRKPTDASESAAANGGVAAKPARANARHVSSADISPTATAEEIVAHKVTQFVRSRRELLHAMAKKFKVEVPPELESFFDRAEAGGWDELHAAFESLKNQRQTNSSPNGFRVLWPVVNETYGVAEAAHNWPAQKLLDYGNAILDSLRPGMIYAGGNDAGLYIPTLLNETTDGERHVVVTQNALADASYLGYLNFRYGDRISTLTGEDSQRSFNDYLMDAQKRLQHDTQFPNEPKQLRPGEDVRYSTVNGEQRVNVSGQVAVMSINEKLFQTFMDKNPDAAFAMEQSFPFASTYPSATPLGPIMELRVQDQQNALTAERATQTVDYWRTTAQQLLSDPTTPDGSDPRKAYAKMVSDQAGLFLDRKFPVEAEQAFKIAIEIQPSSAATVFHYVSMLVGQNRQADAVRVAENGLKAATPDNKQTFRDLLSSLNSAKKN